jgi:hypothetical protein
MFGLYAIVRIAWCNGGFAWEINIENLTPLAEKSYDKRDLSGTNFAHSVYDVTKTGVNDIGLVDTE